MSLRSHLDCRAPPRFIFIKDVNVITVPHSDRASGHIESADHIDRFRASLSSGTKSGVTPYPFSDVNRLREEVLSVVLADKVKGQPGPLFEANDPHTKEMSTEVTLVIDAIEPGPVDDELVRSCNADGRFQIVRLDPAIPDYLARLDDLVARSRAVAWHLSSRRLALYKDRGGLLPTAIRSQQQRRGAVGALLSDDLKNMALPTEWDFDVAIHGDTLAQALNELHKGLRSRVPAMKHRHPVAIPVLVLAMTSVEWQDLVDPTVAWRTASVEESEQNLRIAQLGDRIAALRARPSCADWPIGIYGNQRKDWRPFGRNEESIATLVQGAVDRMNADLSKRDRMFIRSDQLKLVPHWYEFSDLLRPAFGSDALIRGIRDRGCLVVIDELSLLHPTLRAAAKTLLRGENVAVVSSQPIDPPREPVTAQLAKDAPINVGSLVERFNNEHDPRCEIAINSPERLRRWLHFVLPELVGALRGDEAQRNLVQRVNQLFAPTSPP